MKEDWGYPCFEKHPFGTIHPGDNHWMKPWHSCASLQSSPKLTARIDQDVNPGLTIEEPPSGVFQVHPSGKSMAAMDSWDLRPAMDVSMPPVSWRTTDDSPCRHEQSNVNPG